MVKTVWIPALMGLYRQRHGSAGVPARNAALARGDTLILAFSRKGRRDPLAALMLGFGWTE